MTILRVESVTHGVEDVGAGIRFYEDWGLECERRGANGADFVLPSGQTIRVRDRADPGLPATTERSSTVRETIWGVDRLSSLDAIAGELSKDRELRSDADAVRTRDPNGMAIGFCVARPNTAPDMPLRARLNHPFDMPQKARPKRIGHIVYFSTRANEADVADFYVRRLGFRLTDHSLDLGYFLRAAGARDHHTLGVFGFLDRACFGHLAFEVDSLDDVMAGSSFMQGHGWNKAGPAGRHIVGSNVFCNFKNPNGGQAEYFYDMDVMDDSWRPRVFEKHPGLAYWTFG